MGRSFSCDRYTKSDAIPVSMVVGLEKATTDRVQKLNRIVTHPMINIFSCLVAFRKFFVSASAKKGIPSMKNFGFKEPTMKRTIVRGRYQKRKSGFPLKKISGTM